MCSQTEWDVRNAPSNQPAIVWSKPGLATQCANPQCSQELLYLREGRLALLDMELHANDPPRPDDGAFAMNRFPSRYFWLCGECAEIYILKRWTTSGLILVLRNQNTTVGRVDLAAPSASAETPAILFPLSRNLSIQPAPLER
jgi:hypothetical protein